jgi:hypothetical protein
MVYAVGRVASHRLLFALCPGAAQGEGGAWESGSVLQSEWSNGVFPGLAEGGIEVIRWNDEVDAGVIA